MIDGEVGLVGHSDADVIAHAVAEALLGAAGLDDIGTLFPDTDERWRGADSMALLAECVRRVGAAGLAPVNVDCSVIAERPKLAPHKAEMQQRLSQVVGAPVTVKGRRAEGIGGLGRAEGIACLASALVESVGGAAGAVVAVGQRRTGSGATRRTRGAAKGAPKGGPKAAPKGRRRAAGGVRRRTAARLAPVDRPPPGHDRAPEGTGPRRHAGRGTPGGARAAVRRSAQDLRDRASAEVDRSDIVEDIVELAGELRVPVTEVSRRSSTTSATPTPPRAWWPSARAARDRSSTSSAARATAALRSCWRSTA